MLSKKMIRHEMIGEIERLEAQIQKLNDQVFGRFDVPAFFKDYQTKKQKGSRIDQSIEAINKNTKKFNVLMDKLNYEFIEENDCPVFKVKVKPSTKDKEK